MPPRRRAKNAVSRATKAAASASASAPATATATAITTVTATATTVKATSAAPADAVDDVSVKKSLESTNADPPAPAVGTKRKQPPTESVTEVAPRKVAKTAEAVKDKNTTEASKPKKAPKQPKEKKEANGTKSAPKRRSHPKPIYEEVWKDVYLAGTEWDQLRSVYNIDWEFDHLDDLLTEGKYDDKKIYLFGATEPQLLMRDEKDEKGEVIPVPIIVAVISDVAPPSTVGIKSVQRAEEEIVPMSALRMGWHPYAPDNVALSARFKPNVYVLKCNERRARLRNMTEAAAHKYDYVLPYFIKPDQVEDPDVDTNVQVLAELEGRGAPLMCEFDYEMDDFADFVEETIEENELDPSKHTEPLKTAIREAVKATKLKYKAERDERQKQIDAIPLEDREAMKNMKLLKFYPENEWPDVSNVKSKFINRYYGHATEVL